ncbi:hypothetical protein GCE9029_01324 [Grimontia celer]|uniref:Uncharacterized protein n=1 Tax=Grimontia celer TaxID=1796497 RepID=A0A128EXA0_9GAMM|nr:hypothetical protein [Grimontia celer]CZF79213.1 hypothetical protein GCE9029_01324 [Grimontia celer]
MKKTSKYCVSVLLSLVSVCTVAESKMDSFETFLEQQVLLASLREVGYSAGETWTKLLQVHRGEVKLRRPEAESLMAALIDLDMCLNKLYAKHPEEPDVKSAYFITLDDSVLYVKAINGLGRLIGDDDAAVQKLVSNVVCGQYLHLESLKE